MDDGFIPEKALVFEVLKRGIKDSLGRFEMETQISNNEARKARVWLRDRYHGKAPPFSMEWCCDILGADPQRVRDYVATLTRDDRIDSVALSTSNAIKHIFEGDYDPTTQVNLQRVSADRAA